MSDTLHTGAAEFRLAEWKKKKKKKNHKQNTADGHLHDLLPHLCRGHERKVEDWCRVESSGTNGLASNRREGDSQTTLMRGHSKQTSSIAQITFGARQKKKKTIEMSGGKKKWQVLKLCFPRTCCHSCRSPGISQPWCDSFVIVQTQSEFLIPRWHLSQYLISPEMMNNCSSGCVQGICVALSCSLRFRPRISKKKKSQGKTDTSALYDITTRTFNVTFVNLKSTSFFNSNICFAGRSQRDGP